MMPPITSESREQPEVSDPPRTPRHRRLETSERRTLILGAMVLLIIFVVVYAFIRFSSDSQEQSGTIDSTSIKASLEAGKFLDSSQHAMMEPAQDIMDTGKTVVQEPQPVPDTKKTSFREDSLTLEAFSTAPVWFQVKMDTTKSERGSLNSNEHKLWRAKDRFFITLGDAGAVTFFLNGKEIGALGEEGVVVKNVVINRQSLSSGN